MKKLSLPVVITIFCVIIFLGLMAAVLTKEKGLVYSGKVEKVKKEEIKRTDYTQVARRTLDWIDKQRNEQGWYILERGCDHETKTCDVVWDNKEGNKDGLIATWARLNFFEQHGDPKDLEIVKRDIDLFYDKYKDDNLKDSLWLCKTSYEMAQSKHLDQARKDKLKELCLRKEITTIFDVKTLEKQKMSAAKNGLSGGMDFYYYFLVFHDIYSVFGNMSDNYFKYKFTGDLSYFGVDKGNLLETVNANDNLNISMSNRCILGMGVLDMYKFSKSKNNLDYAIDVYEKVSKDDQVVFDPFCGLLLKNIYEVTNDKKYLEVMEKNNRILVENYQKYDLGSFFVSPNTYPKRDVFMNGLFVEIIR
jgi:hypothetical protein